MININATLVVQMIHFLILIKIMNRFCFQPILKTTNERTDYLEKTKNEITEIEQEIDRLKNENITKQMETRKDAALERSQIKNEGMIKAEKYHEKSRKEVYSIREEADKEAETELEKNRPLLPNEARSLAEMIIENVIGRRIKS